MATTKEVTFRIRSGPQHDQLLFDAIEKTAKYYHLQTATLHKLPTSVMSPTIRRYALRWDSTQSSLAEWEQDLLRPGDDEEDYSA